MKSIEQLKKLLEDRKTTLKPKTILEDGVIRDTYGTDHPYQISQGWDFGCAIVCDESWQEFNLLILDKIGSSSIEERQSLLDDSSLEDSHWNWLQKHQHCYDSAYEWFYFIADNSPQAACLVYYPYLSEGTGRKDIFYIEFLAVAPWNRPNIISQQKFKGIGTMLLKAVTSFSDNKLKLSKGFSLHSLPKAEGYYEKIGMTRFLSRDKDGLGYFEMLEKQRDSFLGVAP
ncbi:GNAT family N-acetyltransferase [Shewanella algae]|uniref:GNAT family N-acetyltransferase n=1 Tax=Shewanella algae TaxID=38313 RepID=UPI0031F4ADBF